MQSLLNRLFHKKTSTDRLSSIPTTAAKKEESINLDLRLKPTAESLPLASPGESQQNIPQIIVGAAQSVGVQRDHNEDSIFTLTTNLISNDVVSSFGFYIVADGMGGHEHGELASNLAVQKLASHVINTFYLPIISPSGGQLDTSIQEIMQEGVLLAHKTIRETAIGSGTTLTAALLLGDQLTIAHVGDSRAYAISPDGQMQLLTHDHSFVKRLEEIGELSPDQASTHPKRNLLYRALGQGEPFKPDIISFQAYQGFQLLLCSDGLWGVVPENEISNMIRTLSIPQRICESLINAANAAGGPDNISAILVRCSD